jgi:hypothetical protein
VFTVIVLSDAARQIFASSRVFFEPFEDNGEIAFCQWNQSEDALTLIQALPTLPEIIRGKKEWRAVVVDHAALTPNQPHARDPENPFDFLDNTQLELNLEDSHHALVRIAHALLGYPEMAAKSFEPVLSYTDTNTGARVRRSASDIAEIFPETPFNDVLARTSSSQYDVKMQYREIDYSDEEQAAHRQLVARYRVKEVQPSEVVFVSTRAPMEEDSKVLLRRAWRTEVEHNSSRFVERNDYPPSCRFASYDLVGPENSGYEQDEFRFWLSVLTVATNLIPPSALQAERLYDLNVELSEAALGDALNTHMSKLSSVRERLDALLQKPTEPPKLDVEALLKPQKISLEFDKLGADSLAVETRGYALSTDQPYNERSRWEADFARLRMDADLFVRKPRQVLSRAVFHARAKSRIQLTEEHVLSVPERQLIEDELEASVRSLTEPATADILDRARLNALLAEHRQRVSSYMHQRMRRKTILTASAVMLGAWLAAFVPYIIQAATKGPATLGSSLLVALLAVWIVGVVGVASLFWMRVRLIRLLADLNASMRKFTTGVSSGAVVFADYLSNLATHMQARSLLRSAAQNDGAELAHLRRLHALRARVVDALETEKGIVSSLGMPLAIQRSEVAMFDPQDAAAVRRLFQLTVADGSAEFNHSGEMIDAPYSFISRLTIERITLFEDPSRRSDIDMPHVRAHAASGTRSDEGDSA